MTTEPGPATPTPRPAAPSVDTAAFRQVLGHFPTGVVVVTSHLEDKPAGLSVGSFCSLSLDPPLVLFCVDRVSQTWPVVERTGVFCVNVLADDQEHVARMFSTRGVDRFAGIGWDAAPSGAPILDGVLAWIDCTVERVDEGGDHFIVIGRVLDLGVRREARPLVFFRGGYGGFALY
jgi:3-hydroxy-9,10-secoandrosta-1,3,5(10)-triene-9,17-dione monooxygenase reductase component